MKTQHAILCCITADSQCPVTQAEKALKGGAAMIQLRHKSASGSELYNWALDLKELCHAYNAVCIINDRLDIALAADVDGVHLGQEDLPANAARKLLDKNKILGVSVSSVTEAEKAVQSGADYVGLGHIYPTVSKQKSGEPVGPGRITEIAKNLAVPVIAIGGITDKNVCEVIRAGASGVAVISTVADAPDPEKAASSLIQNMQSCLL